MMVCIFSTSSRVIHTLLLVSFFLIIPVNAEQHLFHNAEKTKTFTAELTDYNAKSGIVSVKVKNARLKRFSINLLSIDDQKYVIEKAKRLAVAKDIRIDVRKSQDNSIKNKYAKKVGHYSHNFIDRVAAGGYEISLSNRSQAKFSNITVQYTIYYSIQDYIDRKRIHHNIQDNLVFNSIAPQKTVTLKTKKIGIVISGKREPVIKRLPRFINGKEEMVNVEVAPGGRRKDLLLGCKADIIVDGDIVKSITVGTVQVTNGSNN